MKPPSPFQCRMWWAALTALSLMMLVTTMVLVGWFGIKILSALSALVTPLAIAGILAYLLDPLVSLLVRRLRLTRTLAVLVVFAGFVVFFAGVVVWIVPSLHRQGAAFIQSLPVYSQRAQALIMGTVDRLQDFVDVALRQPNEDAAGVVTSLNLYLAQAIQDGIAWLQQKVPDIAVSLWRFLQSSLGGALGFFGFLLSLVLVPVFLFFFLREGPRIASSWSHYLPLRASPLKSEIVSLLSEINCYLISFFRGQLLVSMIDGALLAVALLFVGLDFAILIGLMVGILGFVPYLGVIISWVPAVLIATAQYGDWFHPLLITVIFIVVSNLDSIVIAPHIVGESVGLHPLTVIISVLAWSLLLGGILGALLAVPLTATLKVVLKRYFWDRPPSQVRQE